MIRAIRQTGLLLGFVFVLSATSVLAQDWPQWRGPNRDSKLENFVSPKAWPKALTQKWTASVGTGVSSPALVGEKLYVFGRIGSDEVTTCLDAASGKVVWQDKYATKAVGGPASGYGGPRSTPAVAEGNVYTLGVNGNVSCLDAASGKVVWRKDTGEKPTFSTSSSPLVADGKCIVFITALTAFDLASGEVKWKGPGGTPYGSPVLMTVDGIKQVVTPTADSLVGVGLADGKSLWQAKLPASGYAATYGTPIIDGSTVIFSAPTGKGKSAGAVTIAVKIEKKGDTFTATEEWKNAAGPYQYNTPVLKDGLLFGLSPAKAYYCMDAKTGKVLWTDDATRGESGGVLSAGSVVLALSGPPPVAGKGGGKGLGSETAPGESELVAFEPSKTGYKEIAKYKLTPGTGLAYPIVAGNRVYVKGNEALTLWTIDEAAPAHFAMAQRDVRVLPRAEL